MQAALTSKNLWVLWEHNKYSADKSHHHHHYHYHPNLPTPPPTHTRESINEIKLSCTQTWVCINFKTSYLSKLKKKKIKNPQSTISWEWYFQRHRSRYGNYVLIFDRQEISNPTPSLLFSASDFNFPDLLLEFRHCPVYISVCSLGVETGILYSARLLN